MNCPKSKTITPEFDGKFKVELSGTAERWSTAGQSSLTPSLPHLPQCSRKPRAGYPSSIIMTTGSRPPLPLLEPEPLPLPLNFGPFATAINSMYVFFCTMHVRYGCHWKEFRAGATSASSCFWRCQLVASCPNLKQTKCPQLSSRGRRSDITNHQPLLGNILNFIWPNFGVLSWMLFFNFIQPNFGV